MTTDSHSPTRLRQISLYSLIAGVVVYGIGFLIWVVFFGLLLLSFTPQSQPAVYLAMLCYPTSLLLCLVLSFVLYRRNQFTWSFVLTTLPLFTGLVAIIAFSILASS